jgi:hypothetical protein
VAEFAFDAIGILGVGKTIKCAEFPLDFGQYTAITKCYRALMDRRRDRLTALYIDAALNACSTHGVQAAAMAMTEYNVSRETIMRVLTMPRQRRGPGQRTHYMLSTAPADID